MRFASFSAGLYLPESADFAIPADGLLQAKNLDFLWSGGVRGRRGVTAYNASALPGTVRGLWRHYPRGTAGPGTGKLFAVAQDGTSHRFYTGNDGTGVFTEIGSSSLTSAITIPAFVNWPSKNKTFWAYGDDTNGMRSFDDSAIATVSTTTLDADKLGPYLALHKSRLWATYFGETNYSVYASAVDDETSWPAANHLNIGDQQGGTVTGLVSWRDYILIFKTTSGWSFLGDIGGGGQLVQFTGRGCVAPQTLQVTPYGVIFLDRGGLFITDGQAVEELTKPIRPIFASRTTQFVYPDAVGRWFERRQQYWLKLDPEDAGGYILHRVEIYSDNPLNDTRSRVVWIWSEHSYLPMAVGATWDSENDEGQFTVGDDSGTVWYVDSGTQDDGEDYETKIQTASRILDAEDLRTGRVTKTRILHRATDEINVALRYDQHSTDDVTFPNGDDEVAPLPKETETSIYDFAKMGRYLSVIVSRTGDGPDLEIHRIDCDVRFRSRRVFRNRNT